MVVGAGPAGLAAALWCGRYRRRTLLLDSDGPRNRFARSTHGYFSRDRTTPEDLMRDARRDLDAYDTIRVVPERAVAARRDDDLFVVETKGARYRARRLLLATGVEDVWPDIRGFEELYGRSVFHCSCCDGYESSGQDVLAIGWGEHAAGFALDLLEWGAKVVLVTDGREFEGDRSCLTALDRHQVEVVEEPVVRLHHEEGAMVGAEVSSGRMLPATRAFFSIAHNPRTDLARALGCELDHLGYIRVGPHGETTTEHVYAAGDVTPGEQLVQTAAAEGAVAGIACALSLRGLAEPRRGAPAPGPDPEVEL